MRRTAALIVGGGPAGTAAAIALARAGAAPELVERSAAPRDVVCGGFLGWDALAALRRLGLDPEALGAQPIHRLRLVAGDRVVEADLPRQAAGLSRRRLDAALMAAAGAAGAQLMRGRAARAGAGRTVRLDDGEEIVAHAVFLATGKHELRGHARPSGGRAAPPAAGLRGAFSATPALERALGGWIELHLFDGGYAGLLLQEDRTVNLCLSVAPALLSGAGGIDPLLARLASSDPRLGERLGAGTPANWEAVAGIPYGWRARETEPGLFRIGDQGAVIASLAGDGIAIALASGLAAADAYRREGADGAEAYQRRFARRAARPLAIAEALRRSADQAGSRRALMRAAKVPGLAALAARLTRIG